MPMDFPDTPAIDDIFTSSDGRKWRWSGTVWNIVTTAMLDVDVTYPISKNNTNPLNPIIGLEQDFIDDNKIVSIMGAI